MKSLVGLPPCLLRQGGRKKAAARRRAAASMRDVVRQFAEYAPMSLGEPRVTRAVKSFGTVNVKGSACEADLRAGDVDCVWKLLDVAATNSGSAVSALPSPMAEAA